MPDAQPVAPQNELVPVNEPEKQRHAPRPGVALCLSGGGYRAMLYHVGSLWRINELGLLPRLDCISSVSGGSITGAAALTNAADGVIVGPGNINTSFTNQGTLTAPDGTTRVAPFTNAGVIELFLNRFELRFRCFHRVEVAVP